MSTGVALTLLRPTSYFALNNYEYIKTPFYCQQLFSHFTLKFSNVHF